MLAAGIRRGPSDPLTPNVQAFLAMIAISEGTDRAPEPYRVCYGYKHTIKDLNYHPACPRPPDDAVEWHGESLANLGPAYAGLVSTAAGKYQITKHTWQAIEAVLNLPDFTAPSQDDAAILLIKQKGALDMINGGRVADAINACHGIWASLPGSTSGQPQKSMATLVQAYTAAGGAFA